MNKYLNQYQLKMIAIILMVIDHAGALFFPQIFLFRIIGRLSFPLFAFFISEGFSHTRSVKKYLIRLGTCAILFQIPDWFSTLYARLYNVPGFGIHYVLNIFATLFFGLAAITLFDKFKQNHIFMAWFAAAGMAVFAEIVGADYGAYGVCYVFMFYLASGKLYKIFSGAIILHIGYAAAELLTTFMRTGNACFLHSVQLYSLLSIPLIALYNEKRGRKMKVFFYAFYPAHMILLYVIDWVVSSIRQ